MNETNDPGTVTGSSEDEEYEEYYENYDEERTKDEEDYENYNDEEDSENNNYKCGIRNEKGAGVYIRRFELRVFFLYLM